MNRTQDSEDTARTHEPTKHPLVVRVTDNDFQCEVLAKLARLEAKMEMQIGGGQPGRFSLLEDRGHNSGAQRRPPRSLRPLSECRANNRY